MSDLKDAILRGIPSELPKKKIYDNNVSHAPKRKVVLNKEEKKLAIKNALRYFPVKLHPVLATEFANELKDYGRIYMYRYRPDYKIKARHFKDFPHNSEQAAGIMMMLSNNLDYMITTSTRTNHIWRKWISISKLGTIFVMYAVLSKNDRRTNISFIFWSSDGIISVT